MRWNEWVQTGFDTNGSSGDPKFVKGAYGVPNLAPGSPAFAIGFRPIPRAGIGRQAPYREHASLDGTGDHLTVISQGVQTRDVSSME
jgi:hypothetical protein